MIDLDVEARVVAKIGDSSRWRVAVGAVGQPLAMVQEVA